MIFTFFLLFLALSSSVSGTLYPSMRKKNHKNKDIVIKAKSLGRHKELGVNYANFKAHKNSYLQLKKTKVVMVQNLKECGVACVKRYFCLSFNIAIRSNKYGHFHCEVLASDKYNEPSKFVASENFHHFSIATPCLDNPCKNGGWCFPRYQEDTYNCSCAAGYSGRSCQTDINECNSNPCRNGGTCVDGVNAFNCTCFVGFEGKRCDININECNSNPCQNGGTCVDGANAFNCTCVVGFEGKRCEINKNDCATHPCKNGGTCTDLVNDYSCSCKKFWYGKNCDVFSNVTDCADIRKSGVRKNGVYTVYPNTAPSVAVYCNMVTDGGGWTIIQRRTDGSVDFYQNWNSYKRGFGSLSGEFWLGNDNIHRLTASGNTVLRVELEDWSGNTVYAVYSTFMVDDEIDKYKLSVGSYSGTAGDSLSYHNQSLFSTKDQDNDIESRACAQLYAAAWWYKHCYVANLNGRYLGNIDDANGMTWYRWKRNYVSMKSSAMMIRPP